MQFSFEKDSSGNSICCSNRRLGAIIHDQPVLRFYMSKDPECKLKFAGEPIQDGGYGIAVTKGSQLGPELSIAIRKYRDDGTMEELQEKWLSTGCESSSTKYGTHSQFDFAYLSGAFIFGVIGTAISALVLMIECIVEKISINFDSGSKRHLRVGRRQVISVTTKYSVQRRMRLINVN